MDRSIVASNVQDNVNLTQGVPTVAVGQSLKTARELSGKGISEVATQLRIRQPFLEALEDGRHRDLPGGTYAVGFLRTYAEFLGLDGEEMVRRFRAEAAGDLNARSELVFPSPVSEGRIPGGAVLFLGIILAGLAYGVWYFVNSHDNSVAEMVPPIPERLASVLNRSATVADTPQPSEPPQAAPTPSEIPSTAATTPRAGAKPATTAASDPTDKDVFPPSEEDETPKAETVRVEPPKQENVTKVEPPKIEATKPTAQTATPQPAQTSPTPVPAATAPSVAQEPQVATASVEGKVLGQEHEDSRILLKAANDDCWVQVREVDGHLLLSRLLRRGDSYMVPNRPGLTLMAGNAGALEISVDGKTTPSLGAPGQVRRDIKLDPAALQGGG